MQNPWRVGAAPRLRPKVQQVQSKKLEQHELCSTLPLTVGDVQDAESLKRHARYEHARKQRKNSTLSRPSTTFLHGIPAPGILPFPVAPSRLVESYRDIEFFFKEVMPQQHAACEVFDVHDLFDEFLQRPIAAVVFITWQCNISFMRAKLAPSSTSRHQYYQKYGQVLASLKEQLLDTDVQLPPNEDLFITMLLLVNVSYTAETSDVGDLHLMKLYNMLSTETHGTLEVSRFTKSAFRQLKFNCDIVRGRTLSSEPTLIYESDEVLLPTIQIDYDPSTVAQLPEGFRYLINARRLSAPTVRILLRLAAFVPGRPHARSASFNAFEDACPCLKAIQMTFEQLLCLTVMIYCNLAFSYSASGLHGTLAYGARRNLLVKALLVFDTDIPEERLCMIWIFIVSIQSCMNRNGVIMLEGSTLLAELRYRYPELIWSKVESILKIFQWDSRLTKYARHFFETNGNSTTIPSTS